MHLSQIGTSELSVNFIKYNKIYKRQWQVTASSSNKYFDFCPNSAIYLLGEKRNENLDKTLLEQQKCSSACDASHEEGFHKLNVARSQNKVDILVISETKLDSSFPLNHFHIVRFTTLYRLDRNQNGGNIMLYIREDIPSKTLTEIKLETKLETFLLKSI